MEPCQVCGSLDLEDYVVRADAHYVRCRGCGLIVNADARRLAQEARERYDSATYFRGYAARLCRKIAAARRRIDLIASYVPGGRLLDVGCGLGETLVAAWEAGFEVEGLDIGAYPTAHCRGLGFTVHQASITNTGLPDASFDVITLWDIVEHVPSTHDVLAEVSRILKPGGIVAMLVPSGEYLKAHLLRNIYQNYREVWAKTHFVYHNSRTLRRVLREHGLQPLPLPVLWRGAFRRGPLCAACEIVAAVPRWAALELRSALRLTRNLFVIARRGVNGG
jgi:2-polyprenyl-3-methyl-5-hydroxy-6-metoxy-1,4-benzoquinol methylase